MLSAVEVLKINSAGISNEYLTKVLDSLVSSVQDFQYL